VGDDARWKEVEWLDQVPLEVLYPVTRPAEFVNPTEHLGKLLRCG